MWIPSASAATLTAASVCPVLGPSFRRSRDGSSEKPPGWSGDVHFAVLRLAQSACPVASEPFVLGSDTCTLGASLAGVRFVAVGGAVSRETVMCSGLRPSACHGIGAIRVRTAKPIRSSDAKRKDGALSPEHRQTCDEPMSYA